MANRFYIRKFFNKPGYHSTGFIYAYVAKSTKKSLRNGGGYVSCDLTIGDCSRQISLDFDHYSKKDRENSLYKIDTILGAITKFREALVVEYEAIEQAEAERLAEEEERRKQAEETGEEVPAPKPYGYELVRRAELDEILTRLEARLPLADN